MSVGLTTVEFENRPALSVPGACNVPLESGNHMPRKNEASAQIWFTPLICATAMPSPYVDPSIDFSFQPFSPAPDSLGLDGWRRGRGQRAIRIVCCRMAHQGARISSPVITDRSGAVCGHNVAVEVH
jgi:hypothetical protein